jgi:prevent-host-death family protein
MRTITERELRNQLGRVLREVEAGESVRVTIDGQPVADLVPISPIRSTFVPRDEVLEILESLRPDPDFARDVESELV